RGVKPLAWPAAMGHEYVGIVEEIGSDVRTIEPGQFVVGSFWASDNTCEICRAGYQTGCVNRVSMGALGAQAELLRVPLADGTLDMVGDGGDEGVGRIKELTAGVGAHSVVEAVGTQESMMPAIGATRPGGHVGFVGVAHDVSLRGIELFRSLVHLHGGPAPV